MRVCKEHSLPKFYATKTEPDKRWKHGKWTWESSLMGVEETLHFSDQSTWTSLQPSPPPWIFKSGALWYQAMPGLWLVGRISCWPIKVDASGSSLSWEGIHREARSLGVGHCVFTMANLIEEVKEEEPGIETDSVNLEQQASIAKQRKRKMSDQSKGLDSEKVRLPYSCSSSSSPTLPLSGTKHLLNAHPFSQSPPSHPPSIMSLWMTLFSYQIWKLMRKVKSTLQQNEGRDKKGKKSTILVFNHHPQNEKKNENQPMVDEEIRRAFPTVLLTILQVPSCAHLEPETLSNLLSLQESPDRTVICVGIKQQQWSSL